MSRSEVIVGLFEQRLLGRFAPAQAEEPDDFFVEQDLASCEPMAPAVADVTRMTQDADATLLVSTPDVDDAPTRFQLVVEAPALWKGSACGSCLDALGMPGAISSDVPLRVSEECGKAVMMEPVPHALLPSGVEALDGGLEARFAGRSEHRHYPKSETQADDPAERVCELVGTLETGVVVELGVRGQAEQPPVFNQSLKRPNGRNGAFCGPGRRQAAVQRHSIEHVHERSVFDPELLDEVERVEFHSDRFEVREIPPRRRSGVADAPASEQTVPAKHPVDGADRGHAGHAAQTEILMDRQSPILAESTRLSEFSTRVHEQCFHLWQCTVVRRSRTGRLGGEIDAVDPPVARVPDPILDGPQRDTITFGNASHRFTVTNSTDHSFASQLRAVFLAIDRSPGSGFWRTSYRISSVQVTNEC